MQAMHGAMFPLDYEDSFYQAAVRGLDNIFTWAAFTRCARMRGSSVSVRVTSGLSVNGQCQVQKY